MVGSLIRTLSDALLLGAILLNKPKCALKTLEVCFALVDIILPFCYFKKKVGLFGLVSSCLISVMRLDELPPM